MEKNQMSSFDLKRSKKRFNIALVGSRGIPASYSGFETFYENLAVRLVERGHQVTVYNRSHYIDYKGNTYKGVRLVRLPNIRTKHLDTITHTFLSLCYCILKKYDIVYICIVGNSPLAFIPKFSGARVILNVDGVDWKREKWGKFAKLYLKCCEYLATLFPDVIIADALSLQKYYIERFGKETHYIPYGTDVKRTEDRACIERFGLEPDQYILFVGRFVPENGAHILIKAYEKLYLDCKLVLVGGAFYADDYIKELHSHQSDRIIFTDFIYGEDYRIISSHALLYVLPSAINATRPVLLEQMGFGNCVIVGNSPGNLEVIGNAGISYDIDRGVDELCAALKFLLSQPDAIKKYRQKAYERVKKYYSWERVVEDYERLFETLLFDL
jgi:glycosyltransferase involved in cell wall biosynthesis